jgi:DNA-binding NarL/FixJ family response regulator
MTAERENAHRHVIGSKRVVPGWTEQVEVVLTPRERLIVHLIAEGYSNKEIAELLGLSVKTIETDRAAVKRKLNLKSLAALVRYAVRNGLVES